MAGTAGLRPTRQQRLRYELIYELVRKDLKVKYQGSVLGFLWSLANPLLVLIVYTIVFQYILKSTVPLFGLFLLSGLLIWNFFVSSVTSAATSITGNAGLVKKVPFPRSALPLASVGFAAVQAVLQFIVLFAALIILGKAPIRPAIVLIVPALIVVSVMTIGFSFLVAALTVRFRDTQHLLEVMMFAWFWLTPVVYPGGLVRKLLGGGAAFWAYFLNPMAPVVVSFQRALYGTVYYPNAPGELIMPSPHISFYFETLAIGMIISSVVLVIGLVVFHRSAADFAEGL